MAGRCCAAGATPGICVPAIRRRCRPSFLLTAAGKNSCCIWAAGEIRQQEAAGHARYLPGWQRKLRRNFNARNFYLTPEGLVFFYPMYAIAPAMEGIPSFTVPWNHQQDETEPQ